MQQFVNRKGELDALRRAFEGNKAELVVVYGRRRVGKTALVLKAARLRWCRGEEAKVLRHRCKGHRGQGKA
jgi:predicted AAA+ superfamily ATPase